MKTIALDALVRQGVWYGEGLGDRWLGVVKSCIEAGNLGNPGPDPGDGPHRRQVLGEV